MIGILLVLAAIVFVLAALHARRPGARDARRQRVAGRRSRPRSHQLGYDKPLPQQYVNYVDGLAHGDMQMSLRTRRPVTTDLADYLPATLELAIYGMVLAGRPRRSRSGLATAARVRGLGRARASCCVGLASAPLFLLALLGILFFYRRLGWLPATGRTQFSNAPDGPTGLLTVDGLLHGRLDVFVDAMQHLILPALCVAIGPAVSIGRVLRSSLVGNHAVRLRPHRPGQGPARATVLCAARAAQLGRPGAVDGRPAGRADVRRRRGDREDLRVARHRLVHRAEHPPHRLPRDRRRHAVARGAATSSSTPWSTSAKPSPTPRIAF